MGVEYDCFGACGDDGSCLGGLLAGGCNHYPVFQSKGPESSQYSSNFATIISLDCLHRLLRRRGYLQLPGDEG